MFVFRKPASDRQSKTRLTEAADVSELVSRLSIFGFSQLSTDEQQEKTKEINHKVIEDVKVEQLPEENEEEFRLREFSELFKKLPFPDQNRFLSKVIKKFTRERQIGELITWFSSELDASVQQVLISDMVHARPDEETNDEFRLKRFTQLCREYTDYAYMHLVAYRECNAQDICGYDEACMDWQSCFSEFFLGFAVIWFKGQSSYNQRQLIEQLSDGVEDFRIERLADESKADFKLRRYTDLCKKVVDFRVQVQFLEIAEEKLLYQRRNLPHGVLLQPQDYASASELLSRLSSFGFSLLSPSDQLDKIQEVSIKLKHAEDVNVVRLPDESEEDARRRTFTKLFDKAPLVTRNHIFKKFTEQFFGERRFCEAILWFRHLDSNDQQEVIEEMLRQSMKETRKDVKVVILEKLSEETEEAFRVRRFVKLCTTYTFLVDRFVRYEGTKQDIEGLMLQASGNDEEMDEIRKFRYPEFYCGLSIIWFRTRCANNPRNPIQVLVSKVDQAGDIFHKFPNETEEDFRLRRFTESFKQLQFSSQENILKYIQDTVFHDLSYRVAPGARLEDPLGGRPQFAPQFIKVKIPNLRGGGGGGGGGGGAPSTQGGGIGAITRGGQATSQQ